jgi:hypothetical protein
VVPLVFKTSLGVVRSPEGSTPSLLRHKNPLITDAAIALQNSVVGHSCIQHSSDGFDLHARSKVARISVRSVDDIDQLNIKTQIFSCQRVVEIHSYFRLGDLGYGCVYGRSVRLRDGNEFTYFGFQV